MSRLVPAARQLITQVHDIDSGVLPIIADAPDGYGRHRALKFTNAWWLGQILDLLQDPRIASVTKNDDDDVTVTFVADVRADRTTRFDIEGAAAVLRGPGLTSVTEPQDGHDDYIADAEDYPDVHPDGDYDDPDDEKYDDEGNRRQKAR